jgi:hypothetical protein
MCPDIVMTKKQMKHLINQSLSNFPNMLEDF